MTESDVVGFTAVIKRVAGIYRVRTDTPEFNGTISSYFRALSTCQLADLERGADVWIERETKFPKPVEWRGAIPTHEADVPVMSDGEAREWRHAEQRRWQGDPCHCQSCVEAQVDEKSLRFVPDDRRVREPVSGRIVTAGQWIHGWELFRWYQARADFYNRCLELGLQGGRVLQPKTKRSFTDRLDAIFPHAVREER